MIAHMSALEGLSTNKAPFFDGSHYAFWSVQMQSYLMSLGFDVWNSIVFGYIMLINLSTDADVKRAFESNAKTMNANLCVLLETKFVKVMHFDVACDMWEKL